MVIQRCSGLFTCVMGVRDSKVSVLHYEWDIVGRSPARLPCMARTGLVRRCVDLSRGGGVESSCCVEEDWTTLPCCRLLRSGCGSEQERRRLASLCSVEDRCESSPCGFHVGCVVKSWLLNSQDGEGVSRSRWTCVWKGHSLVIW